MNGGKGTADLAVSERRYLELGAEERRIAQELADAESPDAIELHPEAAERYRAKVADIHAALKSSGAASREAIAIVRDLIDHILVTPTQRPIQWINVVGNLALLSRPSGRGGWCPTRDMGDGLYRTHG